MKLCTTPLQAYQCLAALEGTATLAQNTLDGIEALNQQELRKLSLYFGQGMQQCLLQNVCVAQFRGERPVYSNLLHAQIPLPRFAFILCRWKATMSRFEERVFGLLRGFLSLGQQDPALLVAVIRIVEMQEHVDRQILASAHGGTHLTWSDLLTERYRDALQRVAAGGAL